ncbi:auxin-responsive protein SAUR68 [Ricinus communis]|uniref:auxin-responsive protein SAUR68 n=1 Tax=Ricinus communis TaxID=3988 RepID=UPI00201AD80A|nr:auxin-responsive protein SAUR68 [Ricinus communis]
MISTKKLLKLARKWQKMAAIRRKRIASPQIIKASTDTTSTSSKAEKGQFVVYSTDQRRFLLPLEYLNKDIVIELFNIAEEEFRLPSDGPLTLPFEAELLEYAIDLIKQQVTKDVERAFLTCIADGCCSLSFHLQHPLPSNRLPICSF